MFRVWTFTLTLTAAVALVGCGGKSGTPEAGVPAVPAAPPASAPTPHPLFVHLKAKEFLSGELLGELKTAVAKAGGLAEWEAVEAEVGKLLAVDPHNLVSITFCCVRDRRGQIQPVTILTTDKPVDRDRGFGRDPAQDPQVGGDPTRPADPDGFRQSGNLWVHFPHPDNKTVVFLPPEFADQYRAGFAKSPTGWPMTPELAAAAGKHSLFATLQPSLLADLFGAGSVPALTAAKSVTLTADLTGQEFVVAGRVNCADAENATRVKAELVAHFDALVPQIVGALGSRLPPDGDARLTLSGMAEMAKSAAVDVSGTDVTFGLRYRPAADLPELARAIVSWVRVGRERMTTSGNLRQVISALHNASSNYGTFPVLTMIPPQTPKAADKCQLSWRVAILTELGEEELFKQFKLDEPWDSEHNMKLIDKMPAVFGPVPGKPGHTRWQMLVGPKFSTPGLTTSKITDGTGNTISVVEAADPVIWTKPEDIRFPADLPADFRKRFGGGPPGGFHAAMWDGSVRFIPDTLQDKKLAAMLTPAGGEKD